MIQYIDALGTSPIQNLPYPCLFTLKSSDLNHHVNGPPHCRLAESQHLVLHAILHTLAVVAMDKLSIRRSSGESWLILQWDELSYLLSLVFSLATMIYMGSYSCDIPDQSIVKVAQYSMRILAILKSGK
jgi:hypothetical protein